MSIKPKAAPREARLTAGRFYTSPQVASLALDLAGLRTRDTLWDPTCGDGAFLRAAAARGHSQRRMIGSDIDAEAIAAARSELPHAALGVEDLFARAAREPVDVIAGNPPFVRPERLDREVAVEARQRAAEVLGFAPPKKADLSLLTLVHCTRFLKPGGRLALVMPNTWMDSRAAAPLRRWLLDELQLVAVAESRELRWFRDAAVNTFIAVWQRTPQRGFTRFVQVDADFRQRTARQAAPATLRGAARWSPLLRAPDPWFETLEQAGDRLVPLGDRLKLRYGLKPGVSDFFCPRGGLPGVEASCRRPFLRTLKGRFSYTLEPQDADGELFVAPADLSALPGAAAHVAWGAQQRTRGGKPWPEAPSLRALTPWYRIEPGAPGDLVVPQFRMRHHHVLTNEHGLQVNNSAWFGTWRDPAWRELGAALINSSWMALAAEVLGRANLGEGLLTCYGPDLKLLPLPDPPRIDAPAAVLAAWHTLRQRPALPFPDEVLQPDRQALDRAVFAALGLDGARDVAAAAAALVKARVELAGRR